MASHELSKIEEWATISRELSRHKSARYIGQLLGRHHSTISREIDRNSGAMDTVRSRRSDAARR
ncbi:helix-turn-helix domain-containing protein, partial [Frankia sp. Cj3]|uniref:helix-turn-helix domain-containing protein n=1 Tax=Frankia sp. Cj3 TaxID=2880976 RepID=UPI0035AEFCD8